MSPSRYVTLPGRRCGIGPRLLDVGRGQVDPRDLHARRGQAAGDAPVATGHIEDAGAGRQLEQAQDLGRVRVRVRVVDRLLVEVGVVVAERGLHVERHAPSSPPVGSPACPSRRTCPSMRSRPCRTPTNPTSSGPSSTSAGPWATRPTAATSRHCSAGPPASRLGDRRTGLGGAVRRHHLPAAARPRSRHCAHDPAAQRAYGRPRAGCPQPGRERHRRRGVRPRRSPGGARGPLRRYRAVARPDPTTASV